MVADLLEELRQRNHRQRRLGVEIEGKLQVGGGELVAAVAPQRRADAVEHFRRASLGRRGQRRRHAAFLDQGAGGGENRIAVGGLVEGVENADRLVLLACARERPGVGLDDAHGAVVDLVGGGELGGGLIAPVGEVEDQSRVVGAERVEPFRAFQFVQKLQRLVGLAGAGKGPGRQELVGKLGQRSAAGLREVLARSGVGAFLEGGNAEGEAAEQVRLVDGHHAVGELQRLRGVAVGELQREGAAQQELVVGILDERTGEEVGGASDVVVAVGDEGGEIVAGKRLRVVGVGFPRLQFGTGKTRHGEKGKAGDGEDAGKPQGLRRQRSELQAVSDI